MRKWVVGLIAAIAVISVGGVGFAAFTSSVSLTINGSSGTLNIEWVGPASPPVTVTEALPTDDAACSASLTPTTFLIKFVNVAPNDVCVLPQSDGVFIENFGTLPGTVTFSSQYQWPSHDGCVAFFGFPTNLNLGTTSIGPSPAQIPSGGLYTQFWITGSGCQGSTITWWLNETATAGT